MTRDGTNFFGSAQEFFDTLISENYLTANDVKALIAAPGVQPAKIIPPNQIIAGPGQSAFAFFPVKEDSSADAAFIVSKNWSHTGLTTNAPYGKEKFVVFRKSGEGAIYTRPSDATNTNHFGESFSKPLIK